LIDRYANINITFGREGQLALENLFTGT